MTALERQQLLADVDAFCEEVRPVEERCYRAHRFNDQTVALLERSARSQIGFVSRNRN